MTIGGLLNQTLVIRASNATDEFGERSHGADVSVKARIEPVDDLSVDVGGRVVQAKSRIFLPKGTAIATQDQVELEDGRTAEVLRVESVPGGNGEEHHLEVIV